MFCIYLRTNSDLCHLLHKLNGFCNRDEKCLQRGTVWGFNLSFIIVCDGWWQWCFSRVNLLKVNSAEMSLSTPVTNNYKGQFWSISHESKNRICPDSVIAGCNFHFNQCLWRQIQNIRLPVGYKQIEHVRLTRRMCAALHTYLSVNQKSAGLWSWRCSTEWEINLISRLLCPAMMQNQNVPIEMWNIHQHRHRTNSAVEDWNS